MLGICCMWLELDSKGRFVNQTPVKRLQMSRISTYPEDVIKDTYIANLKTALMLVESAHSAGIYFVRVSSALFPLWDKVPRYLWACDEITSLLKTIGDYVTAAGMRLNTHPSQYFVLSSEKQSTVETAIRELNFQGWLFDQMGLPQTPYYNINVHGGKGGRPDALVAAIERLDDGARKRLTLENCEFAYTVQDLVSVSHRTGVPIVVDVHHHSINPGSLSTKHALELGRSTWPLNVRPTTHLSNSRPGFEDDKPARRRVHSDYIVDFQPDLLEMHHAGLVDVEIEAKAKNLTILPLMESYSTSPQRGQ